MKKSLDNSTEVAFNSLFKGKIAVHGKSKGIVCGFVESKKCFVMAVTAGIKGWKWEGKQSDVTIKNNKKGYLFIDANDVLL